MTTSSGKRRIHRALALGLVLAAGVYGCAAGQDLGNRGPGGQPDANSEGAASNPQPGHDDSDSGSAADARPTTQPTLTFVGQSWASDDETRRTVSISLGDPQASKIWCYREGKSVRFGGVDARFSVDFSVFFDVEPALPAVLTKRSFPNHVNGAAVQSKAGRDESWSDDEESFTIRVTSYTPTHITGTISGAMRGLWIYNGAIDLYLDSITGSFDMDIAAAPPPPSP